MRRRATGLAGGESAPTRQEVEVISSDDRERKVPSSHVRWRALVAFVLAVAVLAFLYGFAASRRGWFPHDLLMKAWAQAKALVDDEPDFVVPRVYDRSGARVLIPDRVQPGLTLISTMWEDFDWQAGLRLIDERGNTVHEWPVAPDELFPDSANRRQVADLEEGFVNGFHLFPNGDVLVNVLYVGTARLDACGDPLWTVTGGTHHSIAQDDDGTFWIPGSSHETAPTTSRFPEGLPGLEGPINHDRILHVTGGGEIIEEIEVLDILYLNGLQRYIAKAERTRSNNVTHLNDVEPLPDSIAAEYPLFEAGDLVISLRNINLVLVWEPETGDVKWHTDDPFVQQHDPDYIGDGWIAIFDNQTDGTPRGAMLGGSRVVAVQPHTDSTEILFPTPKSDPFYTSRIGELQKLENGNLLLTESRPGRVVEVAPDGRSVWEWVTEPYDESRVPRVFGARRYGLDPADVASWPCSPPEAPVAAETFQTEE